MTTPNEFDDIEPEDLVQAEALERLNRRRQRRRQPATPMEPGETSLLQQLRTALNPSPQQR